MRIISRRGLIFSLTLLKVIKILTLPASLFYNKDNITGPFPPDITLPLGS